MLSFGNDYSYGACPEILDRLARTNDTAFPGYGSDAACEDAKRRIREACETPDATCGSSSAARRPTRS